MVKLKLEYYSMVFFGDGVYMVSIYNIKDLKEKRSLIIDSFSVSEDTIKKKKQ